MVVQFPGAFLQQNNAVFRYKSNPQKTKAIRKKEKIKEAEFKPEADQGRENNENIPGKGMAIVFW